MTTMIRRRSFCLALASGVAAPASAQAGVPLEIGVLPNISARVLMAQYQPVREYLARALGRPVQVSTAPSWQTFHQRVQDLEYDIVVTAAHLARVAQLDRGYVPLLSYAPGIKGLLVHAGSRPLGALTDLQGRTLALSNPQSLVTMRGMQWLADAGLVRDRDFRTVRTPTDDSVGNVVVRGDAVAAMLSGGEYRAIPEPVKAQLQVFTTFAEVASFVVLASPRLPAADAAAIKAHLRQLSAGTDEGKAFFASSGFTGMVEPPPGLMESMDPFVEPTRKVLATPG